MVEEHKGLDGWSTRGRGENQGARQVEYRVAQYGAVHSTGQDTRLDWWSPCPEAIQEGGGQPFKRLDGWSTRGHGTFQGARRVEYPWPRSTIRG